MRYTKPKKRLKSANHVFHINPVRFSLTPPNKPKKIRSDRTWSTICSNLPGSNQGSLNVHASNIYIRKVLIFVKSKYFSIYDAEKRGIRLHQKIFRQINFLVTYLVKPLLSRNFCQKCVIENFHNFHTAKSTVKRDHTQKFPWNQLFSNLFSKTFTFTKFLPKLNARVSERIPVISTLLC